MSPILGILALSGLYLFPESIEHVMSSFLVISTSLIPIAFFALFNPISLPIIIGIVLVKLRKVTVLGGLLLVVQLIGVGAVVCMGFAFFVTFFGMIPDDVQGIFLAGNVIVGLIGYGYFIWRRILAKKRGMFGRFFGRNPAKANPRTLIGGRYQ
jgi:hypothetical protein